MAILFLNYDLIDSKDNIALIKKNHKNKILLLHNTPMQIGLATLKMKYLNQQDLD